MYWINFLHIYQPTTQSDKILKRVVNESYLPLFEGLLDLKNIKINLNISGALTELLSDKGYSNIIEKIKKLAETGRLEFTETAKYHAFLPVLDKKYIKRQIEKNKQSNLKYFGESYKPFCFFPPEMAYSKNVEEAVREMGYEMIILDEISYKKEKKPKRNKIYKSPKGLKIAFRERRVSNSIMSGIVRSKEDFREVLGDEIEKERYLCTAMDGETFGHHRPGLEKSLFEILSSKKPKQIFLSELPKYFKKTEEVIPNEATWASSAVEIKEGTQFYSWKNPENKVQNLQWEFVNYLLKLAEKKEPSGETKEKIDKALASDQFFWGSGEPWWSIEMIEKGAWSILQALKSLPKLKKEEIKKAENYYKEILSVTFWWQRSGKIEKRAEKYKEAVKIPFKERTLEKGKPEVYYAFIELMERKIQEAVEEKNFEKAILWRDAVWKLETKNDIYDAIHAVDLLRTEIPDDKITKLMDKYKEKYKKIRPGQPEPRKIQDL